MQIAWLGGPVVAQVLSIAVSPRLIEKAPVQSSLAGVWPPCRHGHNCIASLTQMPSHCVSQQNGSIEQTSWQQPLHESAPHSSSQEGISGVTT